MIATKILGGLGNQFFQYAIGKRTANLAHQELFLDVSDFATYHRPYVLKHFAIEAQTLDEKTINGLKAYKTRSSWRYWLERSKPINKRLYREEQRKDYYRFIPEFLDVSQRADKTAYFSGYWQNPEYLAGMREELELAFRLKPEFTIPHDHPLLLGLADKETIAVHFRRGDYVTGKTVFAVPENSYYIEAVNALLRERPTAQLYVFSNDIAWVKEHVSFQAPTFYVSDGSGLEDYQEFELMRLCQHHVIANSTFSWWAAWLKEAREGITYAPDVWLTDPSFDTRPLILPNWRTLSRERARVKKDV